MTKRENNISKIILGLGILIIIGGITGSFICGKVFEVYHSGGYYSYWQYNWTVAVFGSIGSLLFGAFYIALSEIIELLDNVKKSPRIVDTAVSIDELEKQMPTL